MSILVTCACSNTFRAPDEAKGKDTPCPACGKTVTVAGPTVSPFDVFVSYSSKDKTVADAAVAVLESRGLRCWVAPRDIVPGKEWSQSIIEGLNQCRMMVLIFSANSNNSQQVSREVERAVNRNMPIVPFRIENVMPSKGMEYFISSQHWLDAYQPPLDDHLEKLEGTCQSLLAGRGDQPAEKPRGLKGVLQAATRTLLARDNRVRVLGALAASVLILGLLVVGAVYFLKDPKAPDDVVKARADAETHVESIKQALKGQGFEKQLEELDTLLRTGQGSFGEKKFDAALASFKEVQARVVDLQGQAKVKSAREALESELGRFPAGLTAEKPGVKWQELRATARKQTEAKQYDQAAAGYAAAVKEFRETITPQICYLGFWCGYGRRTIFSWRQFEAMRKEVESRSSPSFPIRVNPPPFPSLDTYQQCRNVLRHECQPQLQLDERLIKDVLELTQVGDLWAAATKPFHSETQKKGGNLASHYSNIGWDLAILEGSFCHQVAMGNEAPFYYRYLWLRLDEELDVCHRLLQTAYRASLPQEALSELERLPLLAVDIHHTGRNLGYARSGWPEYHPCLALVKSTAKQLASPESAAAFLRGTAGSEPPLSQEQKEAVAALRKEECLVFLSRDDAGATRCCLYLKKAKQSAELLERARDLPVNRIILHSSQVDDDMFAAIGQFPLLQQLDLYGRQITEKGLRELQRLPDLRVLNVSYFDKLGPEELRVIGSLKGLRRLSLPGTKIDDEGLTFLCDLHDMEELYLQWTRITAKGLEHLRGMSKLRVLDTTLPTKEVEAFKKSMPGFQKK